MHNSYDKFGGSLTLEHNQLGLQDPFILHDFQKNAAKAGKKRAPLTKMFAKKDVGLSWSLVAMFPWLFGCFLAAASRAQRKVAATNHSLEASKLRLCSSWMAFGNLWSCIRVQLKGNSKDPQGRGTRDPPYHSQSRIPWSMGMVWVPLMGFGGPIIGGPWRNPYLVQP